MQQLIKTLFAVFTLALFVPNAAAQISPSPVFYKTQNSDEWVRKTLHIQSKYARVFLVDGSGNGDRVEKLRVTALDLNNRNAGPQRVSTLYTVNAVYKSLQEAADAARGGDLIAVMPGTYAGFVIGDKPDAGDGHYIHFKALGKPGDCIINRASARDPDWMVLLQAAHHVVVEGSISQASRDRG